jgi:hypothetical protein
VAADKERLLTAQWVFERQLAWIAAADVKVAAVVALNTGLLGGLAAAFGASSHEAHTGWAFFLTLSSAGMSVVGVFCAAMAMHPRVEGPAASLLFFGRIAKLSGGAYHSALVAATDADLLKDWADQIHRNAQVAGDKYWWVKRGMGWSFIAAIPWVLAIGLLVKI